MPRTPSFVQKAFLGGGGLTFRGAYFRGDYYGGNLRFKLGWTRNSSKHKGNTGSLKQLERATVALTVHGQEDLHVLSNLRIILFESQSSGGPIIRILRYSRLKIITEFCIFWRH